MNLKPLNKQILIKPKDVESRTSSGLIVTGGDGDNRRGVVISVADEVEKVKTGDEIIISWDKAMSVKFSGERYAFVNEDHVVAVVVNDEQ